MEIFIFWFIFSVVIGVVASSKGRSGFGWWLLAMLISPLLALILVLVFPAINAADGQAPTPETHVRCPDCRELVLKDARVCNHCDCKLTPQT